jgi:hypothetical protein
LKKYIDLQRRRLQGWHGCELDLAGIIIHFIVFCEIILYKLTILCHWLSMNHASRSIEDVDVDGVPIDRVLETEIANKNFHTLLITLLKIIIILKCN